MSTFAMPLASQNASIASAAIIGYAVSHSRSELFPKPGMSSRMVWKRSANTGKFPAKFDQAVTPGPEPWRNRTGTEFCGSAWLAPPAS